MKKDPRQQRFIEIMLADPKKNERDAAIEAGFTPARASYSAFRMLQDPVVASIINQSREAFKRKIELTEDYVLGGIIDLVEMCKKPILDPAGHEVPVNGQIAIKGLELLGKHMGTWKDVIEHRGQMTWAQLLLEAEQHETSALVGGVPEGGETSAP